MAIFVDDDDYRLLVNALERVLTKVELGALVRALANIEPSAVTGTVTKDEIMIALCESADVLPEAMRDHCESADVIRFSVGR